MPKPYKIAIIGYPVTKPQEISSCFSMLTYGLTEGFKGLSHVTMADNNIIEDYNPLTKYFSATLPKYDLNKIEPVDFIIAINYCRFFNQPDVVDTLRKKCRKVVSFLECPAMADYCFVFKHTTDKIPLENQCQLPPVYLPEFTKNMPKEPKSILLDHMCLYWLKNPRMEWSQNVWKWLSHLSQEYKIYSLVDADVEYGGKGNPQKIQLELMPKFITPIFATNYMDYMKKTETMETFVVVHQGSYNFSVVDMAARGMRVFAPQTFVPKVNEDLFKISNYSNQEELLNLIQTPVKPCHHNILRCISIQQVANIMDGKFQSWL
jgi:hypothetical protein